MNRETWLEELVTNLKPLFDEVKVTLPKDLRISCGWPSRGGTSKKRRVLGQCWKPEASKDGHTEIYINPYIDDNIRVADVTIHELIHSAGNWQHRKNFKKIAREIGLKGPANATEASDELREKISKILEKMPPYPHKCLNGDSHSKQSTSTTQKVCCLACGYNFRISNKWLEVGIPNCVCGEKMTVS